jgi:hypothetical protein
MRLHRGINTTSVTGEGLDGLPGLLIAIAFPMLFAGIFIPHKWFLGIFLAVEAGAAILYLLSEYRNRRARRGSR